MILGLHPSHITLLLDVCRAEKNALQNQGSERANTLREIIHRLERTRAVLKDEGIL